MFRLLKQMYPTVRLTGKPRVIRSRDWMLFLKARQLLNECQSAVENAEKMIDHVYEKEKERGFQDGAERARVDMAAEQIRFSQRLQNHIEQVTSNMNALVCHLVEKFIGTIPEQQRLILMIGQAIANLKSQERVKIHVRPEYVQATHANLQEAFHTLSAPGALTVEPNANLIGDQCMIEAGGLVIEMSLASYMEALKKSMRVAELEQESGG